MSLALSGCNGSADKPSSGVDDPDSIVKSEGAPTKPTGVLKIAASSPPASLDPAMLPGFSSIYVNTAYDTLTSSHLDGTIKPWLATEWSQPDPNIWRFKLRDDVTFHDGSKFDAQAVKLNLERGKNLTGTPWGYVYQPISAVTVVDPTTVDVSFTTPQPAFPLYMSSLPGAMVSPTAIQNGTDLTRTEAGSGGWIWSPEEEVEGSKEVFHANPDYWNPDAIKAETIEVNIIEDNTARQNAVESGQVDINGYLQAQFASSAKSSGLTVIGILSTSWTLAILDREGTIVPAFADEKVRQAMLLLIDHEAFNEAALSDNGFPTGQYGSPDSWWYDKDLDKKYSTDVKKAKQLLAEAGYPDGFSFDAPDTTTVRTYNEAIAQLLAEGGITMNLVPAGTGEQYNSDLRQGKFAAGILAPSASDPYVWWNRSISNHSPYNPFGLTDLQDLEAKFVEMSSKSTDEERKPLLDEIQDEVLKRGIAIPTAMSASAMATAKNVHASHELVFPPISQPTASPYYIWVE